LRQIPVLVGAAARKWDDCFLCSALSAIAAAKGFPLTANATLELDTATAERFMKWFYEQ
jgi:hypothetical protein